MVSVPPLSMEKLSTFSCRNSWRTWEYSIWSAWLSLCHSQFTHSRMTMASRIKLRLDSRVCFVTSRSLLFRRPAARCGWRPFGRGNSYVDSWAMHPPFSFPSCGKENGPCTVQKKRPLLVATLHMRAKLLYGGRRIGACSDLALPSGTLYSSARTMLPSRGGWCGGHRAARTHLTSSSFRAFRFATRCPVLAEAVALAHAAPLIDHRPAAAKIGAACIPNFPGLEASPRAGRFRL